MSTNVTKYPQYKRGPSSYNNLDVDVDVDFDVDVQLNAIVDAEFDVTVNVC